MIRTLTALAPPLALAVALLGCGADSGDLSAPETTTTTSTTSATPTQTPTTEATSCPTVAGSEVTGRVANSELTEISGLAVSELNPGALWVHNDSGGSAAVYALSADGTDLGVYPVEGVENRDWEDMARWRDPETGTDWLYIGDIGDNLDQWDSVFVHRVPEPIIGQNSVTGLTGVETFEFNYPDGAHNAETLLVDPASGEITIVTNGDGTTATVFQAPSALPGTSTTLVRAGEIDLSDTLDGLATAGDHVGELVLIRTYAAVLAFPAAAGNWWEAEPCELDAPFEIQGETIAGEPTASAFVTVPEGRRARITRSGLG